MEPDWRDRGEVQVGWRCREIELAGGSEAKKLKAEAKVAKQPSVEALAWRHRDRAGDFEATEKDADDDNEARPCDWRDRSCGLPQNLDAAADAPLGVDGLKKAMDLDLTVVQLREGRAEPLPDSALSVYARNGMSKERLATLKRQGACSCAGACVQQLDITDLHKLCESFWRLGKCDQDFIIYTMYAAIHPPRCILTGPETASATATDLPCVADEGAAQLNSQGAGLRTVWTLCGQRVCMEAFHRCLGIGKRRLLKMMHGSVDGRGLANAKTAKEAKATALCDRFFAEHYRSTAEPMPHEYTATSLDEAGEANYALFGTFERSLIDLLPQFLTDVPDTGLPVRYLQHARLHDLYWLFVATVSVWLQADSDVTVPAWSTFWRCWNARWCKILVFRKSSTHSQCNFCWRCQQWLAKHISLADKLTIAERLKEHLRMQYTDRCLYWSLRWASKQGSLNVLTVIIDSMDKSKFGIPQWPHGVKPKLLDELIRPTLTLTGCMAHGCATCLFLADETVSHGADAFLEVLLRTLDFALQHHQLVGRPFPEHLVLQSDNPTNQAKNSLSNVFLAALVAKYKFQTCTLNFLTVGHTHEDIDQLFGIVTELLRGSAGFQSPDDVQKLLEDGLGHHISAKGERLHVQQLSCVRDFSAWLQPLGTELHNAFQTRKGVAAPHSFYFKRRQDLFDIEAKQLALGRSADFSSHPLDVFVLVKQFMHSKMLQQPPLLCIPLLYLNRLSTQLPTVLKCRHAVDEDRKRKLIKFAGVFRDRAHGVTFDKAASYYEELASGGPQDIAVPASAVLTSLTRFTTQYEATSNAEFPHLPATSWELKVRFKA